MEKFRRSKYLFLYVLYISSLTFLLGCSTSFKGYYSGQKYKDIRFFYMGERLYNACKYAKAVTAFKRYLTLYPDEPLAQVAMYYLGKSYQEERDFTAAKETFQALVHKYGGGFWVDSAKEAIVEVDYLQKYHQGPGG